MTRSIWATGCDGWAPAWRTTSFRATPTTSTIPPAGCCLEKDLPAEGFRACLRTADRALYEAKRQGGDVVVVQEPPDPPMATLTG